MAQTGDGDMPPNAVRERGRDARGLGVEPPSLRGFATLHGDVEEILAGIRAEQARLSAAMRDSLR